MYHFFKWVSLFLSTMSAVIPTIHSDSNMDFKNDSGDIITLISSDGVCIEMTKQVAVRSEKIKRLLDSNPKKLVLNMESDSKCLNKIINFMTFHDNYLWDTVDTSDGEKCYNDLTTLFNIEKTTDEDINAKLEEQKLTIRLVKTIMMMQVGKSSDCGKEIVTTLVANLLLYKDNHYVNV